MKFIKKRPKYIRWFLSKPKTTGYLVFLILSIGVTYTGKQRLEILQENGHKEMGIVLNAISQNIDQCLKSSYTTMLTLALTINDNGIPENFDAIASQLLETNNCISIVQMVPKGVIKYIYPMKGNEAAMNLNLLNWPPIRREALKSIVNRKMYFAGPLVLKQGGMGIVGRLPVFKKNRFWGFSAVVIKFDTLLKMSGINSIDTSKYYFQFSKRNPNTQKKEYFIPRNIDFSKNYHISTLIPDGNWVIYLVEKKHDNYYSVLLVPTILGYILAVIFGAFITLLLKKPEQLQQLVTLQATKLLNSEIKFKTIFDQAPLGIALVDNETGNFLEINKKFCDLMGYSEQEMKSRNYQSITHPKDIIISESGVNEQKEGGIKDYSLKKRYITKSKSIIWVNLIVSSLSKINNNSNTNIAIIEDITSQKQILENFKKSEKQFKNLFNNSPIPMWEVDLSQIKNYLTELNLVEKKSDIAENYFKENPDVVLKCFSLIRVIAVNYKCLQLLNIKSKKDLNGNLEQVLDTDTLNDFIKQLTAITQNNNQLTYDGKIKNSLGESINIHFRWNAIRGYEKTMGRMIISTEDITFRKKNEKTLLASQHKIESLINTIDGIVWEFDMKTFTTIFVSKKVEEILGYTSQEWLRSPNFWKEHIHPEDRKGALEYSILKTQELSNHDFEYRMIAKNGKSVWLRDMVNVVFENDKAVSLRGIMIDITKSKNIENDLNNSFNLVTKQNERLLNFSYIISHNLRSHTSNIASIVSLINSTNSEQEKSHLIQLLVSVSDILNETMLHLNEVINIRTNINLTSEPLNLNEYIDNVLKIFAKQIKSKNITVFNLVPDDLIINYNPAYLESILFNIISNAIRYHSQDRNAFINIAWTREKNKNYIQIADNGIGIDLIKNGEKIFGMYKTFSDNPDSKGVGLFITKNQIEAMGGTISIESAPNIGTTFKIEIL